MIFRIVNCVLSFILLALISWRIYLEIRVKLLRPEDTQTVVKKMVKFQLVILWFICLSESILDLMTSSTFHIWKVSKSDMCQSLFWRMRSIIGACMESCLQKLTIFSTMLQTIFSSWFSAAYSYTGGFDYKSDRKIQNIFHRGGRLFFRHSDRTEGEFWQEIQISKISDRYRWYALNIWKIHTHS